MTHKEPKEMVELHKIREAISKEYRNKSNREINRQLLKRTAGLSGRLNLPRIEVSTFHLSDAK